VTDDPNAYNKNVSKRIAAELAEADDPIVKAQLQLDHWWSSQRALAEAEMDMYEIGGFIEYHSNTPSFHKSRRDRDWGVR
jgi:hypothetical protein